MAQPLQNLVYNEKIRSKQYTTESENTEENQQLLNKEKKGRENIQALLMSQYSSMPVPQFGSTEHVPSDVRFSRPRQNVPPITRSMSAPKPAKLQREYSPEREADTLITEIWMELKAAMKRVDKPEKMYICYHDIRKIWTKKSRVSTLIRQSGPSAEQVKFIQEHMIIILSTLVWIGDSRCLAQFKSRFFEPMTSCKALFTDKDMPVFEKNQLKFIDTEPVREHFYADQFLFTPVRIDIEDDRESTQKIDPRQRLPFEEIKKGVGSGGFGKVDRVSISPKYYHSAGSGIEKADMSSNKVFVVACKKIKLEEDFAKERENLQILKESLTNHRRIMLHLTTIEHGLRRYIMLPYAQYGDLEVFLHGGYASKKEKKYEFDHVFTLGDRDLIVPLLAECLALADALKWLHSQISIERTSDKVFCAHMDLKPANILIHPPDAKNPVGKWMISDFGISVFREDTEQHDPEYGSIGDYISQVTMNTRPKRQEGTYQAPEVKIAEKFKKASHLTPDQQGIGRKSDVWSFGCILSEILAFSQGRAEMVKEFSDARKRQNHKDDYFYIERSQNLAVADQPQNSPKTYEVRPTVTKWLDQLCERVAHPRKWMYCYVSTIKKILVVDTKERPNGKQLLELLKHTHQHIRHSLDGTPVTCQVLNPKEDPGPTVAIKRKPVQVAKSPEPIPESSKSQAANHKSEAPAASRDADDTTLDGHDFHFFRQTTFETKHIDTVKGIKSPHPMEIVEEIELEQSVSDTIDPFTVKEAPEVEPEELIRPDPHPVQPVPDQPDNTLHRSSHFQSFARPAHAHGIVIDRYPPPAVQAPVRITLPQPAGGKMDISAMSLTRSSDGPRLACLSKSSVYIYTLKLGSFKVTSEPPIVLSASDGWKDLVIAGDFLVAWGWGSRRLIHFCNTTTGQSRPFSAEQTGMQQKATVSVHGVVVLVCRRCIFVATLDTTQDIITLSADAEYEQNFTHAAFNDTGDLLFAWAYGQVDKLYCWRCENGVLQRTPESESPYETAKGGKPDLIKVIPYNSYHGCIVEKPDKKLFPAQIRATLRNNYTPFSRNETQISDLHAACVFNDFSLITVEKGMIHRRLREYQINYKGTHVLATPPTEIGGKFSSSTDETSKVLATKDGDDIVIVICNKNATVDFIKVVSPRGQPVR